MNKVNNDEYQCSALLYGKSSLVPHKVAVCPECGAQLFAESTEWASESGEPSKGGLVIDCVDDANFEHRYWQSDWQSVVDAIAKWCGATDV